MRSFDWANSPLGPPDGWPQSLKTAVRILLTSRQPMFVWWGPHLINLYNDAYRSILGGKHPEALGQPASVVWREIWDAVGPRAQSAMSNNEGTYDEALRLIMERYGYPEETYYTFSYSPVPDDNGEVGGIFCANTEDTQRIIGERQLALLRELAACAVNSRTVAEACAASARALESNPLDLPFALVYVWDHETRSASLAGQAGIELGHTAAPLELIAGSGSPWPLEKFAGHWDAPSGDNTSGDITPGDTTPGDALPVSGLRQKFPGLPTGGWDVSPDRAVMIAIGQPGQTGPAGILIAGLNPYRLLDEHYAGFLKLVAGQIGSAISNARVYEDERRRVDALMELDRAKTAFFSNVSHEFRTPLTLMLGPLEELLRNASGSLQPEQLSLLEVAQRNGARLLKLVNSLLDFSRIEAVRTLARFHRTRLAEFTRDIASTFRSTIEKAGLRLEVHTQSFPDDVWVDLDMWEKIVLNLLSNAFKFTFEGAITVRLEPSPDGRHVRLSVEDTGTGIPANELPRVFERFHRVEGARGRTFEGTGIGLALVQELVKLHGGEITAASEEGRGSTFTVTIPIGREHLPADQIDDSAEAPHAVHIAEAFVREAAQWTAPVRTAISGGVSDSTNRPGLSGRVLLADDNADMREYVCRLLSERFDVTAVSNGREALEWARRISFDLILTDAMMPELDGFGLLKELRSDPKTAALPIILLSARAGEESRMEGLHAGADDYLVKPFSARELYARVSSQIAIARFRREIAEEENQLRQEAEVQRRKLHETMLEAPAMIAVVRGPRHLFEMANPAFLRFVGRQASTLMGQPLGAALPEIEEQGFAKGLNRAYRTGRPYSGNEVPVLLDPTGSGQPTQHYVNFFCRPTRNAQGLPDETVIHAIDVTDLVNARRQAEQSGEDLKNLAASIPQLVWSSLPDGTIDYRSSQWAEYTGLSAERLRQEGAWQCLHPDDTEPTRVAWQKALQEGSYYDVQFRIRRFDGVYRWFKTRALASRDSRGQVVKWFGTCTDIEDQMRAEAEREEILIREKEARSIAEVLVRVGPTLLAELDQQTLLQKVTDLATELIGAEFGSFFLNVATKEGEHYLLYTLSGGAKEAFADFPPPQITELFRPSFAGEGPVLSADITKDPRYVKNSPPGGMPPGHLPVRSYLAIPVISRSGVVLGTLLFGHPVPRMFNEKDAELISGIAAQAAIALDNARLFTESQQAQAALRLSNDELQLVNGDLEQFAFAAAHDLQEPLRMVTSFTQLLRRRIEQHLDTKSVEYMGYIVDGAKRMSLLLQDLLAYTETSRDSDAPAEVVNLSEVVSHCINNLRAVIADTGAKVLVEPLPVVLGREVHYLQLLQNLIGNAIKYRIPAIPPEVTVRVREQGDNWEFAVQDNGMGIEPAYQRIIFGVFKRLHGKEIPGTGIGLAICQRVVERAGGRIWVQSEPGRGSIFYFTLPIHRGVVTGGQHFSADQRGSEQ